MATLETEKKRQTELLKDNLQKIDPDLKDVVDCQSEMQGAIIEEQKQLDQLRQRRTSTLEEEKQKQMDILRLSLHTDPDLSDVLDSQAETQEELVAKKKEELEQVEAAINEKLKELDEANHNNAGSQSLLESAGGSLRKIIGM